MLITRQNPHGGPELKGYPFGEDPATHMLGHKIGYCGCGCGEPLYIRTVDLEGVVNAFGMSVHLYRSWLGSLKPKESIKNKIIKLLGGKVRDRD